MANRFTDVYTGLIADDKDMMLPFKEIILTGAKSAAKNFLGTTTGFLPKTKSPDSKVKALLTAEIDVSMDSAKTSYINPTLQSDGRSGQNLLSDMLKEGKEEQKNREGKDPAKIDGKGVTYALKDSEKAFIEPKDLWEPEKIEYDGDNGIIQGSSASEIDGVSITDTLVDNNKPFVEPKDVSETELRNVDYSGGTAKSDANKLEQTIHGVEFKGDMADVLKENRTFLQVNDNYQVGYMLVVPITSSEDEPFEFNPMIDEGGVAARYQAFSVLSRIGNMQTFTGVDSLVVTLSTKYFAVSNDAGVGTHDGWMQEFTMDRIQAIETAYRSLVLPFFPSAEGTAEEGYRYVKPPIVKVIMGPEGTNSNIYSNLLTHTYPAITDESTIFSSHTEKKFYRSFIVTNVTIKKDIDAFPLYLEKYSDKYFLRDTFGFEVSMSLTEVTHNYMDIVPDFKDLYNQYSTVVGKNGFA